MQTDIEKTKLSNVISNDRSGCVTYSDIAKVHLELLDSFIRMCDRHDLKYCLGYGTLLGAVRNRGMIPWDYDVDVWVPYSSYNKLIELKDEFELYQNGVFLDTYDGSNYYTAIAKLKKKNTTGIWKNLIKKNSNIFMDIFPLLGVNNTPECMGMVSNIVRDFFSDSQTKTKGNHVFGSASKIREVHAEFSKICEEKCDIDISTGEILRKNMKNLREDIVHNHSIPHIDFEKCLKVEFCGIENKVNIPQNYDEILTKIYGDYMTPIMSEVSNNWLFDANHNYTYYDKKLK